MYPLSLHIQWCTKPPHLVFVTCIAATCKAFRLTVATHFNENALTILTFSFVENHSVCNISVSHQFTTDCITHSNYSLYPVSCALRDIMCQSIGRPYVVYSWYWCIVRSTLTLYCNHIPGTKGEERNKDPYWVQRRPQITLLRLQCLSAVIAITRLVEATNQDFFVLHILYNCQM